MADSDLIQNPDKTAALADRAEENTVREAIENEPWRNSKTQVQIAEGIIAHEGARFGLHVSPEMNEKIDPVWREPNGWYEGLLEAYPVTISFPGHFPEEVVKNAHRMAKSNEPEAYQAFSAKMFVQPNEKLGYSTDRNLYGEGISLFETPIETLIHVAPDLNEKIDPSFRSPDGWYDDPGMRSIITVSFPERFEPSELAEARQYLTDTYKDPFPEIYERIIAQTPPPRMDDQDDLTTSLEGSATKSTPDLKDLMAAFDADQEPAEKAAAAGFDAAIETDTLRSPQQATDPSPTDRPATSARSPEGVSTATPDVTGPAETRAQIDPVPRETSNSVEVSSAKPAPELKDLIAVFDSDEETTSKTADTPESETNEKPALTEAKTDTTPAPVTHNTTEKRVITNDKYEVPSTPQNSNTAATTVEIPTNAEQSSPRQGRQNNQQHSSDRTQQPITAASIIAGAIASGIANTFGRKPHENRPSPQEAAPARNEPIAPSQAQPPQNTASLKPEATPQAEPASKASTPTPAQPTQTASTTKADPVAPAQPATKSDATVYGPSNPVGGSLPLRNLLTDFRSPEYDSITPPVVNPTTADDAPARPGSARALLDKFSASRMQPRRDADLLQQTERAAATAVNSFEAVEKADSAAILTRIREAAEASPGGMKEVISEMRPGGAYEDLRKEFDATLARDEHFSTAYENAASALDAYANQREKAAPILQNGNTSVLARLEAMDEKIVKAASQLPGTVAGKSTLDEALEKSREAVMNIVNSVRGAFSRQAPSASPSISP